MIQTAGGDPPPEAALDLAARALVRGGVVVLPTDTVYGLAVDPTQEAAARRLFALKGRPPDTALAVLVAGLDQARELAEVPEAAALLMDRFWPGALTVVVPRRGGLGLHLGGPDDLTVGLRLPAHPVPVALCSRVGPLAVTSANRHGRPTLAEAAQVAEGLGAPVDLVLDGGPCRGTPSTVVVCGRDGVKVVRDGAVPMGEVLAVSEAAPGTTVHDVHHQSSASGPRYTPGIEVLLLCTGNHCRSPMAEVLLRQRLERRGLDVIVSSAGFLGAGFPVHASSERAMVARGLDLSSHRSRTAAPATVTGADLVIGMARSHVREAALLAPGAWSRIFTLKELVRRGEAVGPRRPDEPLGDWLDQAHAGRRSGDLLGDSPDDDVADPLGGPDEVFVETADEIEGLLDRLVDLAFPALSTAPGKRG